MTERFITDEEQRAVMAALDDRGIFSTLEYPGVVAIRPSRDDLPIAWTGLHSWVYGSWCSRDGEPIEDGSLEAWDAGEYGLTDEEDRPAVIAEAWLKAITCLEQDYIAPEEG
ncbi:MAG: hypothetical protein V7607_1201 [Solirubrobacteraceae bacterium]